MNGQVLKKEKKKKKKGVRALFGMTLQCGSHRQGFETVLS